MIRGCSAAVIVLAALVRLTSVHPRTPWWDLDPSRQPLAETGLLPSWGLVLDALVWVASGVGVCACVAGGQRLKWKTGVLALSGAVSAAVHAAWSADSPTSLGGPDDLFTGSAWAASIVGGWALTQLAADARLRGLLTVVLLGAGWMLAARGAHQVFIEHPRTVATFRSEQSQILAAQGIEPGSAAAREFERRALQPEAIGWVGLSNANATVLAASLVGMAGLLAGVLARRETRGKRPDGSGETGVLVLGVMACALGLILTFSKGGLAAGALGGALLGLSAWAIRGRARVPGWVVLTGPALAALALGAVAVRGVIGERVGELSLLFRSQYLVGACGTIGELFPRGTGPGGFKAFYALHKPALSPELVESAHSVLFDWTATLGLGGAAWGVLLTAWSVMITREARRVILCRHLGEGTRSPTGSRAAGGAWLGALIVVGALALCWCREYPTVAPDEWPLRVVGAMGWLGTIVVVVRAGVAGEGFGVVGCCAAALGVVTHAQIEVTPVLPGTGAWVFALIGVSASCVCSSGGEESGVRGLRRAWAAAPVVAGVAGAGAIVSGLSGVVEWERELQRGSAVISRLAGARGVLDQDPGAPGSREKLLEAVEIVMGGGAAQGEHGDRERRAEAFALSLVHESAEELGRAWSIRPHSLKPAEHALRMRVELARTLAAYGRDQRAKEECAAAVTFIDRLLNGYPNHPGVRRHSLSFTAGALVAIASVDGDRSHVELAARLWGELCVAEPGSLTARVRLADSLESLGRHDDAVIAAREAVRVSESLRLDPIKQLQGDAKRRIDTILEK